MNITLEATIGKANDLCSLLNMTEHFSCSQDSGSSLSCFEQQEVRRHRRLPDFRPAEMCWSCAALWHAGQALNALHQLRRVSEL